MIRERKTGGDDGGGGDKGGGGGEIVGGLVGHGSKKVPKWINIAYSY